MVAALGSSGASIGVNTVISTDVELRDITRTGGSSCLPAQADLALRVAPSTQTQHFELSALALEFVCDLIDEVMDSSEIARLNEKALLALSSQSILPTSRKLFSRLSEIARSMFSSR